MIIESIKSEGYAENTWIVAREQEDKALIIDPGCNMEKVEKVLEKFNLTACKMINTHLHPDHLISAAPLQDKYNLDLIAHNGEKKLYDIFDQIKNELGFTQLKKPVVNKWLNNENKIEACNLDIEIISTPGHSPGSICLLINDKHLFSGDTLFPGSIGRTDLPFGSRKEMRDSLQKLGSFPINTKIYPGHGEPTSLEKELNSNPYLI